MIKIATIGPESSGKTTLCKILAKHFNGLWTPEYARDYLTNTNGIYNLDDLELMAQDQFDLWQELPNQNICFFDTEMINFKIWSLEKYQICSKLILGLVDAQHFDLYLLCSPDIDYHSDNLREYPQLQIRQYLFERYKKELDNYGFNYAIIQGDYLNRKNTSISIIESKFKLNS